MIKISPEILKIIQGSDIDGNKLFLPKNLDRNVYVAVNKILESIGLKWNRSAKCHIAEHNVEELIESIINSGEWVDEKKLNQFYATPSSVIDQMLRIVPFARDSEIRILEPSAGAGAILGRLIDEFPNAVINFCEINEERMKQCIDMNVEPVGENFLHLSPVNEYDLIVMNPPFSKQQDIDHFLHAFNHCLKSGGFIVSIMPEETFFRDNKKTKSFWKTIRENSSDLDIINLPENSFKESGTMIRTRILWANKE
jgi:type I restriction-modification system DNA methylase subunit